MGPSDSREHQGSGQEKFYLGSPCACHSALLSDDARAVQPNLAWAPTQPELDAAPKQGQLVKVPAVTRIPPLSTIVMPVKGEGVFIAVSLLLRTALSQIQS